MFGLAFRISLFHIGVPGLSSWFQLPANAGLDGSCDGSSKDLKPPKIFNALAEKVCTPVGR